MKSSAHAIHFAEFTLDAANRQLLRNGRPIELGSRYFDALAMLAGAPGQLITKHRLHEEVWRGVPVTDEALSQAIKTLRRALGDDAARPRFIETVPRHGYRFIAAIEGAPGDPIPPPPAAAPTGPVRWVVGGLAGAGLAGVAVGLLYGGVATAGSAGAALSLVLVLIGVSALAAMVSGLGIATGIALAARRRPHDWWRPVLGGALGGLTIGGFAGLLGLDTLRLLTGSAPARITGAPEGLAIGFATGLAFWLAQRRGGGLRPGLAAGSLLGGLAGLAVTLTGGLLMAGSLAALVAGSPGAALSLGWIAGERWLAVSGAFEGALFTMLVTAGMVRLQPA